MLDYSREFIVLAKSLNYTTAARELNISQPSLSRHIASLETRIGFQLLKRNPMALTAAGKYYMEAISNIIKDFDKVVEHGSRLAQEEAETLSIYMLPGENPYSEIVYESIARLNSMQNGFSPQIHYNDRINSVYDAVLNGKADVGVLLSEPESIPEEFVCEWLVEARFCAWVHKDNPVLNLPSIALTDLADCYLVASTNQSSRTWFDSMVSTYHRHNMEPKFHLKDLEDHVSFYLSLGPNEVLLAAERNEKICPYNPRLVMIKFDGPQMTYSSYLFYKKSSKNPFVTRFVDTCRHVAEDRTSADG